MENSSEQPQMEEIARLELRMDSFYEALHIVEALTEPLPKLQEDVTEIDAQLDDIQGSVRRLEAMLHRQTELLQRNPPPRPRFEVVPPRMQDGGGFHTFGQFHHPQSRARRNAGVSGMSGRGNHPWSQGDEQSTDDGS